MINFPERYKDIEADNFNMKECMKRPIKIKSMQVLEEFRVNSIEGDYAEGKPGDYLMCGIDDELYICDQDIFKRSYDWV